MMLIYSVFSFKWRILLFFLKYVLVRSKSLVIKSQSVINEKFKSLIIMLIFVVRQFDPDLSLTSNLMSDLI